MLAKAGSSSVIASRGATQDRPLRSLCEFISRSEICKQNMATKRKPEDMYSSDDESSGYNEMISIDPDGDLNLNLHDPERPCTLLVSRHILCLSSSVFRAMIGRQSRFQEATNPTLSKDGCQEVMLEGDDIDVMEIIMNMLHLQHQHVPDRVTFDELYRIAITCDKYDLTRAMGRWPSTWCGDYIQQAKKPGFERWLRIAWIFRQREVFAEVTKYIIFNSKIDLTSGELLTAAGSPISEGVPLNIIGMDV